METRERPGRGSAPGGEGEARAAATRRCPRCGEVLFADMDVCYGCLYDFRRRPFRLPEGLGGEVGSEPEPAVGVRPGQGGRARPLGEASVLGALGALEEPDLGAAVPAGEVQGASEGGGPGEPPARAAMPAGGELAMGDGGTGGDALGGRGAGEWAGETPPRQLCLRVQTEGADVLVPVTDAGITVGRDPANDVVLHANEVSRYHLRVTRGEGGVRVIDLGATNPALHDGMPLEGEVVLVPGDAVDVCGARLALVLGSGARPSRAGVA